ncbi:hypothetical protein H4R21_001836 [Coemansia helicoidea]|uniref:Uncharacterized protein n=1 Tax=Coemansia helicoidea TaxID=1286919 RepID=A0ACC1LAE8_9FUNG|nr:hypothetical protein H4R21_001836 [Coemansia helicoidea]
MPSVGNDSGPADIKCLGLGLGGVPTAGSAVAAGPSMGGEHGLTAECTGQLSRDWVQSIIAQAVLTSSAPGAEGMVVGAPSGAASQDSGPAASSDSDSDDISRSLSLFLSHQLAEAPHPPPDQTAMPFPALMAKGLPSMDLSAHAGLGAAFTDMLDIGYDHGSRRVISMPNPLGNLSFEIPINPPMDAPAMSMPGHMCKEPSALGVAPVAASLLAASRASQRQVSSGALLGAGGMAGLFALCPPAVARAAMPLAPALAYADGQAGRRAAEESSSPEEPMSQQMSPKLRRGQTVERLCRREGARGEAPSPAGGMAPGAHSSASTPLLETAGGPLASSLLPHRVDRQLAEGTRPLLFVRPSTKPVQSRRRKRRCISTNDELLPGLLGPGGGGGGGGGSGGISSNGNGGMLDDPHSTQWQRISEQRRRDAMRENFDLLKRMLPQEYMSSDDGRELARPVLLSRFLRWVDDTLIEMENLKSEVARLRLLLPGANMAAAAAAAGYWAHGPAMSVPAQHAPPPAAASPARLVSAPPSAHPL